MSRNINLMAEALDALESFNSLGTKSDFSQVLEFVMKERHGNELQLRVSFENVTVLRGDEILTSVNLHTQDTTVKLFANGIAIGEVTRQPQCGAEGVITSWNAAVACHFFIEIFDEDEALVFKDGTVHVYSTDGEYYGIGDRLIYLRRF